MPGRSLAGCEPDRASRGVSRFIAGVGVPDVLRMSEVEVWDMPGGRLAWDAVLESGDALGFGSSLASIIKSTSSLEEVSKGRGG